MWGTKAGVPDPESRRSWALRYGLSLVAFLAALVLTWINPFLHQRSPTIVFMAVMVASAWFAGTGPAIMVAAAETGFLVPIYVSQHAPGAITFADLVRVEIFGAICLLIIALSHRRQQAERRLRASERHFRVLLENTSDIITILDPEAKIRYESPSVERVLGYEPGEMIGRSVFEFVHPEDKERIGKFFLDRLQTPGLMPMVELRLRNRAGEYRVLEALGSVLLYEPGNFGVIMALRDVTERKRVTEGFRSLLESAPDAIVGVDAEGNIALVNSRTEEMFGYTREELLGQPIEMLVPERMRGRHIRQRAAYAMNPQVRPMATRQELVGRRKNGTEFAVEISLSPMQTEHGLLVTSIIRDVTERKRAEEQRAELIREQAARVEAQTAERRFRELVQDVDAIVWELDLASGRMTYVNPRAKELLGYPAQRWLGSSEEWLEHVHPDDRQRMRDFLRTVADAAKRDIEYRAVASHGRQLWLRLMICVTRDQENHPLELRGLTVDITERKQAEETLRLNEKLAATGRLAASIAHEINNPIAAATNLLYLIETEEEASERIKKYAQVGQEEMQRVAHITRQMLAFYRDSIAPLSVDVTEVLKATLALYDRRLRDDHITVEREFVAAPAIVAFPGEMRQVFSNLLLNAVEAVGSEGRIRVRVRPGCDWSNPQRNGIHISIADSGSGVSREIRRRIFEPFFTTKGENGTGLGLWVSNGIVQKHGGRIRMWSSVRPGRSGTCFSIFLPTKAENGDLARAAASG